MQNASIEKGTQVKDDICISSAGTWNQTSANDIKRGSNQVVDIAGEKAKQVNAKSEGSKQIVDNQCVQVDEKIKLGVEGTYENKMEMTKNDIDTVHTHKTEFITDRMH